MILVFLVGSTDTGARAGPTGTTDSPGQRHLPLILPHAASICARWKLVKKRKEKRCRQCSSASPRYHAAARARACDWCGKGWERSISSTHLQTIPASPPLEKAISVALIHSRAANYRPALRRAARHNPANHGAGRGVSALWACQRAVPQHVPGAARLQTHPLGCKRGDEKPPCWGWSKQGPQKPCRAWCTQLWLQRGCKSPPLPPASARSAEPAAGAGGEGAGCSLQPLLGACRDNWGNHGMKGPSLVPAFPKTQMAHTRQLPKPELSIPASQPDG